MSRPDPRRRRADCDVADMLTFDVASFEFVPAGEDLGLLRLAGSWEAPDERVLHDVVLVASVGAETTEILPLPDPSGSLPKAAPDGAPWRAAFSLSTALAVGEATEFALCVAGEDEIRLPRPGDLPEVALAAQPVPAPSHSPADAAPTDGATAGELGRVRKDLARLRIELEVERRRYAALEDEIRSQAAHETDLRNEMAMKQAELAAAAQASERAMRAQRERERAMGSAAGGPAPDGKPLDPDLLQRIVRARQAAEAA